MVLAPCPFCGFTPDRFNEDCIYPATRGEYDPHTDKIVHHIWNLNCVVVRGVTARPRNHPWLLATEHELTLHSNEQGLLDLNQIIPAGISPRP